MSLTKKIVLSTACLGVMASLAFAGGHAKGEFANEIKARQAQMTLYSFNLGILGAMAKGEMDYDAELAGASAANLLSASKLSMAAAWPQGSDNVSIEKGTRALPAAWEKWPDIANKGQDLAAAAEKMAAAAGTDLDSLRGAIGAVGEACGACHKAYRAPIN
ncbi:MAG: cytochrome c [Paracoccaceae bacterium]